nr:hypothetical protein [uncultured Sphaerochaeta sp.]
MRKPKHVLWLLLLVCCLILGGCSNAALGDTATLVLQLNTPPARSVYTPSIETDIASYRIVVTGSDEVRTVHAQPSQRVAIQALQSGQWTVEVAGFNGWDAVRSVVSGVQVAQSGIQTINLVRGEVAELSVVMVPHADTQGSLTLTTSWSDATLISGSCSLTLSIRLINDLMGRYEQPVGGYETTYTAAAVDGVVHTFSNLPSGWYEVRTLLESDAELEGGAVLYQSLDFAHVVANDEAGTQANLTITDSMLHSGSAGWEFSDQMEQELGSLGLAHLSEDTVLYTQIDQRFSTTYASATATYQWYVDGVAQTGATQSQFTHRFQKHGRHTVLVAVSDRNAYGAEHVTVDIKPGYTVGGRGPAGGYLFYADATDVYSGWTYLEASGVNHPLSSAWSTVTDTLVGTSTAMGTGKENTQAIVSQSGHTSSAASMATWMTNNYYDWFLPSRDELATLRATFPSLLGSVELWTSSESGATDAYLNAAAVSKSTIAYVRQIRRF